MIACVRLPHFAAYLEEREHPELRGKPFVLVDGAGQRVTEVSLQAAQGGIRVGMSLTQARAQCAGVLVRPAVPSHYQRVFESLLAALTTFTPQVEAEEVVELRADGRRRAMTCLLPAQFDDRLAATCYLDLGRLNETEVPAMAQRLQRFVWQEMGCAPQLGLSSGKFPARVAAMTVEAGEALVVPAGQEARFLAGFTVALLPVDGETLRQLDLLGWHTLGDVAAQPVAALLDRFGQRGRIMHHLARGHDTRPVQRYSPPLVAQASRQWEEALTAWGQLEAALDDLVETAAAELLQSERAVRQITLRLGLDGGAAVEQHLTLRQPVSTLRGLQETVRDMAHTLTVTNGVVEAELILSDIAAAVPRQLSLFDRPPVSQSALSTALKDLVARYGEEHFFWVKAVAREARLPERRYRWERAR